jgi:hypothetical protein
MMPPICAICGVRFPAAEGGTVRFSNFTPLPEGRVGHPKGLVWVCGDHIAQARALSDMTSTEAIRKLK